MSPLTGHSNRNHRACVFFLEKWSQRLQQHRFESRLGVRDILFHLQFAIQMHRAVAQLIPAAQVRGRARHPKFQSPGRYHAIPNLRPAHKRQQNVHTRTIPSLTFRIILFRFVLRLGALRSLAEACDADDITKRLLAMPSESNPDALKGTNALGPTGAVQLRKEANNFRAEAARLRGELAGLDVLTAAAGSAQ